jgi:lysozyme
MKTSQKGLDLIKKFEGFNDKEYICPAGKITIGYGHVILPNEYFQEPMTRLEGELLLKKDLISREESLNTLVKVNINQNQFDSLISLIYNIGIINFKQSTLLKFINDRLFNKVPEQFRRWKYVNKVVSKGLFNRREEEIKLWLN